MKPKPPQNTVTLGRVLDELEIIRADTNASQSLINDEDTQGAVDLLECVAVDLARLQVQERIVELRSQLPTQVDR